MDQLQDVLRPRRAAHEPVEDLEAVAQELHRRFVAAEREALGHALARCDLDVPAIEVEGERSHRVLRCATTSTSAAGPVRVERSVDRRPQGHHAVCPLALRAGSIAGAWTPWAATHAPGVVAHVTPKAGEALFALLGHMTPSKSPRDRLPTALRMPWEAHRPPCEATLRHQEALPDEAVALAVSRDGVRAPRQEGARHAKRHPARATGQSPRGPMG